MWEDPKNFTLEERPVERPSHSTIVHESTFVCVQGMCAYASVCVLVCVLMIFKICLCVCLFIFGCTGSLLLHANFL